MRVFSVEALCLWKWRLRNPAGAVFNTQGNDNIEYNNDNNGYQTSLMWVCTIRVVYVDVYGKRRGYWMCHVSVIVCMALVATTRTRVSYLGWRPHFLLHMLIAGSKACFCGKQRPE